MELRAALDGLQALAGRTRASSLVATAAARVALADGLACPQEITMLEIIRARLGLGGPSR